MSQEKKNNDSTIFDTALGLVKAIHVRVFEKQKEVEEHARKTKERIERGVRPPEEKFRL